MELLENMSERFLFVSSGEVYGDPVNPDELVSESDYGFLDSMNVRSCYAESKRIGETMTVSWANQYDIHASVVRPFHTYGPSLSLNDGRVFADFVSDIVNNRDIVLKSHGDARRSFCYISDAIIAILSVLLQGEKNEAYNIGNPDTEIAIKDLASELIALFPEKQLKVKFKIKPENNDYLKSPVNNCSPSIEKIKKLGWSPEIGTKDGFKRTVESFL